MLSQTGEIRRDESCIDYAGQSVMVYPCHGMLGNQEWIYGPVSESLSRTRLTAQAAWTLFLSVSTFLNIYLFFSADCFRCKSGKTIFSAELTAAMVDEIFSQAEPDLG
jgi:hypothetical protein